MQPSKLDASGKLSVCFDCMCIPHKPRPYPPLQHRPQSRTMSAASASGESLLYVVDDQSVRSGDTSPEVERADSTRNSVRMSAVVDGTYRSPSVSRSLASTKSSPLQRSSQAREGSSLLEVAFQMVRCTTGAQCGD